MEGEEQRKSASEASDEQRKISTETSKDQKDTTIGSILRQSGSSEPPRSSKSSGKGQKVRISAQDQKPSSSGTKKSIFARRSFFNRQSVASTKSIQGRVSSEFIKLKKGDSRFNFDEDVEDDGQDSTLHDFEFPKSRRRRLPTTTEHPGDVNKAKYGDYDRISITTTDSVNSRSTSTERLHRKQILLEKTDLEVWWLDSPRWRRFLPFMLAIIFTIGCSHLICGFYFLIGGELEEAIPDPYICRTESCKSVGDFIERGLDETVDPCVNFYNFTCGNYEGRTEAVDVVIPKEVALNLARLEFNQKSITGSILKKTPETIKRIIPFYKSCINTRLRKQFDLDILVKILNDTLKPAFDNMAGFNIPKMLATVAGLTGQFGMFRLKFGEKGDISQRVIILPPHRYAEVAGFNIHDDNDNRTITFIHALRNAYKVLWSKFNFSEPTLAKSSELIANKTLLMIRIIFLHSMGRYEFQNTRNDTKETIVKAEKSVREILDSFLNDSRSSYLISSSPVFGLLFEPVDVLDQMIQIDQNRSQGENVEIHKRQVNVGIWIYNMLWVFANHLDRSIYEQLNLNTLFPNSSAERSLSTERACFESLVTRLGPHVIDTFQNQSSKQYEDNTELLHEIFRRTYRAQAKMFRQIDSSFLYPDQAFISSAFSKLQAVVTPIHAFSKSSSEEHELLRRREAIFDNVNPSEHYLENIALTRRALHQGIVQLWREGIYSQQFKYILLERINQHIQNEVNYRNEMYFPLTTFDLPYIANDLTVLDHSGTGLIIAKSLLTLWFQDREDPAGFLRGNSTFLTSERLRFSQTPKYRPIKQQFRHCTNLFPPGQPGINIFSAVDLANFPYANALAFKLAYDVYKNPNDYQSFVSKTDDHDIDEAIRFVYNSEDDQDPTPKFFRIEDTQLKNGFSFVELPPNLKEVDVQHKFDRFDSLSKVFKRKFKKLPKRLEKYTTDQLFFISAVRHQCFQIEHEKDNRYIIAMNEALREVTEFAQAFNCPLNAPMVKVDRCLQ